MPHRTSPLRRAASACCCCCTVALAAAAAQAGPGPRITVIARIGDTVPGVGPIRSIDDLCVNDAGEWFLTIDTDAPTTSDAVILGSDGQVVLREGDPIEPAPATVAAIGPLAIDGDGRGYWPLTLAGVPAAADSGLYLGTTPLLLEGAAAPTPGFAPGTVYGQFFVVKVNRTGQALLRYNVEDPTIPSSPDHALVLAELDGAGQIVSQAIIAKEDDLLPGQTNPVFEITTRPQSLALNDAGQPAFVADLDGLSTVDDVVYLGGTLIAQEGSPSPIAGQNWSNLGVLTNVGVNNAGVVVHTGEIDAEEPTDEVIVRGGAPFRREGFGFPGIDPFVIRSLGFGPVQISDAGEVLWYGSWDNPSQAFDNALFIDETPLISRGLTIVESMTVTDIDSDANAYTMSPSGRYIIAQIVLNTTNRAAVIIDRESVRCAADWDGDAAGVVNSNDISSFLTSWLASVNLGNLVADFDGSGEVNSTDISAFLTAWLDAVQNGC